MLDIGHEGGSIHLTIDDIRGCQAIDPQRAAMKVKVFQ
jgi:hypothetical protein